MWWKEVVKKETGRKGGGIFHLLVHFPGQLLKLAWGYNKERAKNRRTGDNICSFPKRSSKLNRHANVIQLYQGVAEPTVAWNIFNYTVWLPSRRFRLLCRECHYPSPVFFFQQTKTLYALNKNRHSHLPVLIIEVF